MNKRFMLLILLLFTFSFVRAQNDSISLAPKAPFISGGYLFAAMEYSKVSDFTSFNPVFGGAVILKDHIDLGVFLTWYGGDEYVRRLVFPNEFDMAYRYGGGLIGYHTTIKEQYRVGANVRVGHGEVLWERVDTGENLVADKMLVIEPQISLGYLFSQFLLIECYTGYRSITDLNIVELTNDDFSGFQFGFKVKAGFFRKL